MNKLTQDVIASYIKLMSGDFHLNDLRKGLNISPEADGALRKIMYDLCKKGTVRSSGSKDGNYHRVEPIMPIRTWVDNEEDYFEVIHPKGHGGLDDDFGFEAMMDLSPGDLITIGGVSNAGKSALALNYLAENVNIHPCVLMGNEYVTANNEVLPKLKRRLLRMDWVKWLDGEGKLKFEILPVSGNYQDYIQKDKLNIIDWIDLSGEFWQISQVHKAIKERVGDGLIIAVQQKSKDKTYANGNEFGVRMSDVYFTVDFYGENESRINVLKVKEPRRKVVGKSWAFMVVDNGAKLTNIREIKLCPRCRGRSQQPNAKCEECHQKGYVDA